MTYKLLNKLHKQMQCPNVSKLFSAASPKDFCSSFQGNIMAKKELGVVTKRGSGLLSSYQVKGLNSSI